MRNKDEGEDFLSEIYSFLKNDSEGASVKTLFELISEKKEEMGVSNYQMADILGIDKTTFSRILKKIEEGGTQNVDFYSILKICQFLGIGIDEMSKLFVAHLSPDQIGELELSRKANYIITTFDLKGLRDSGFIDTITDFKKIENRIITFFGLTSIFQYKTEVGAVAFSRTKASSADKMREFWVRAAHYQFSKIDNPNEFNRNELLSLIPKIAPYSRYVEKGFHHVIQALYNIGITVIVQGYLTKTQIRGGTFAVNNKPCIVVTDFNKSYPYLWFALMHEIYHVLYDFEQLKTHTYHLTGEPQSELLLFREPEADAFAWEMLFPKEKREYIKHVIKYDETVFNYAKENLVHPGIVYASYCEDLKNSTKKSEYGFYQHHFGKSQKAVHAVKSNPWDKAVTCIDDEMEKIKESLKIQYQ